MKRVSQDMLKPFRVADIVSSRQLPDRFRLHHPDKRRFGVQCPIQNRPLLDPAASEFPPPPH